MYIKKEYTILAESIRKVAKKAFDDGEEDLGELLTLVYTCHYLGIEKELLDILKLEMDSMDSMDNDL